uniref:Uncharacterized protein n=1 Tax=Ditylenchus dipsaci TaxID=166011 RepID=A0A915E5C8_9BILA
MRRGICYQTRRNVNQTEADDIGRLMLSLKAPPSITSEQYNFIQPQIIIYVNDNHEQVLDFPRFYMYPHEWNRMHFTTRLVELLEHPQDCTSKLVGKDANCFVRNWLNSNVIDPYNCTVPYLKDFDGVAKKPTCRPHVIAKEYYNAIQLVHSGSVHSQEYEHVKEVYTTSVPGFMSQIGGQFGFFLGLSIITMIQILIYSLTAVAKFFIRSFQYAFAHFQPSRRVSEPVKSEDVANVSEVPAPLSTPTLSHHSLHLWPSFDSVPSPATARKASLRVQRQETRLVW